MKLSIVVPVYNERNWIHPLFKRLRQAPVDRCAGVTGVEIVLVDDGSVDGTGELLETVCREPFRFEAGMPAEVRLIRQPKNAGKGAAVRIGIESTTGDIVLIQDADLEYSPEDYPALLEPITTNVADAVFGSRFTGHCRRVLYFWHSVMNKFLTLLSNMLNDVNLTDMETGYKVMRGGIARSLRLTSSRFGIEPELTARLAKANVRLYEVPIRYNGRSYEEGKKIRAKDGIAALFHIVRFGLFDREPFKPGLMQTLNALDSVGKTTYVPLLKRALKPLPPAAPKPRILEIGAGIGTMTSALIRYGDVIATDISAEFVEKLKVRFGLHENFAARVWDASGPAWEGAGKFDLIVAFNILEHIENDEAALSQWSSMLNEGGTLVVLVPNYPRLFSPIDEAVGHFRRYDKKALLAKLAGARLETEKFYYGNALGIAGWTLNGLVLKRSFLPSGQLHLYARLKKFLGAFERGLERFMGLSIIAVARRESAR